MNVSKIFFVSALALGLIGNVDAMQHRNSDVLAPGLLTGPERRTSRRPPLLGYAPEPGLNLGAREFVLGGKAPDGASTATVSSEATASTLPVPAYTPPFSVIDTRVVPTVGSVNQRDPKEVLLDRLFADQVRAQQPIHMTELEKGMYAFFVKWVRRLVSVYQQELKEEELKENKQNWELVYAIAAGKFQEINMQFEEAKDQFLVSFEPFEQSCSELNKIFYQVSDLVVVNLFYLFRDRGYRYQFLNLLENAAPCFFKRFQIFRPDIFPPYFVNEYPATEIPEGFEDLMNGVMHKMDILSVFFFKEDAAQ